MTIKIDIIKTEIGYNYRNSESRKLIGTIKEGRDKPGIYFWGSFGMGGWASLEQAHSELQYILSRKASELGVEIEFTNI